MSNKVKFISVNYLKENTTIQDNLDSDILVPYILKVQDTHLQQVLGSKFYNRLKNGVVNNDLNSDEESLLRDYIQPMVSEWAFYEVLPHINYKPTNKAISQESSEFSQASGLDEIKYLRQSIRNMAEFYTKRLTKFLCDNENLFPQYATADSDDNLQPNSRSYFNGMYLPKRGGKDFGFRSYNDPSKGDCC